MSMCFGVNVHIFMMVCTGRRFTGFYGVRWTLYRVRGWKGWKHALRAFYGVFVWGVDTSRTGRNIFTAGLNFTLCGVVLMGGVDIHIYLSCIFISNSVVRGSVWGGVRGDLRVVSAVVLCDLMQHLKQYKQFVIFAQHITHIAGRTHGT